MAFWGEVGRALLITSFIAGCAPRPTQQTTHSEEAGAAQTLLASSAATRSIESTLVAATLVALETDLAPRTATPIPPDPRATFIHSAISEVSFEPRKFARTDQVMAGAELATDFGVMFVNHLEMPIGINDHSWLKIGQLVDHLPVQIHYDFHPHRSSVSYDANENSYFIYFENNFELVFKTLTAVFGEDFRHGEMEIPWADAEAEAMYWTSVLTRRTYGEYLFELAGRKINQPQWLLDDPGDPQFIYATDIDFVRDIPVPVGCRIEGDLSILPRTYRDDLQVVVTMTSPAP